MKKCAVVMMVLGLWVTGLARADAVYVNGSPTSPVGADSPGRGTAAAPYLTVAYALANGALAGTKNELYLAGTLRAGIKVTAPVQGAKIAQWAGMPQAVLRGDTPTGLVDWVYAGTAGVFDLTIFDGSTPYWTNPGDSNDYTLTESIVAVVVDWDTSIDTLGRHFGHLRQSSTAVAASMPTDSWFFTPNTPGSGNGGGGTLRIKLREAYASEAALQASGLNIAYCLGNQNGIELGTPTYTEYPTWGAYAGTNVNGAVIDGIHVYLFADSGYRKNKPASSGTGDDNSAYGGAGNSTGTVSIGYGIRIADGVGCTVKNCVTIDSGYHGIGYVGDACRSNRIEDCDVWGGAPNTNAGNSSYVFYTGPGTGTSNITDCVGLNCRAWKYTFLGRGQAGSISAHTAADPSVCTSTAHGLATGDLVTINASASTPPINGTYRVTVTSANAFSVPVAVTSGAGTATWVKTGAPVPFPYVGTDAGTAAAAGYAAGCDGFICHTNAVANNSVLDVEWRRCEVIESGDLKDNSGCIGQGFVGGSNSAVPANLYDCRTYPVRYVECRLVNAAKNLLAGTSYVSFERCRFELTRLGAYGNTFAGGSTNSGGNMGSLSGTTALNLTACEVIADLGHAGSSMRTGIFHLTATSNVILVNSSVFNVSARTSASSNVECFAQLGSGTGGAERFYARGSVFGHKWCASTTAASTAARRLFGNAVSGGGPTEFIMRGNYYFNIDTDKWIEYSGGASNYIGENNYKTSIDSTGIYPGSNFTSVLSQDPNATGVSAGQAERTAYMARDARTLSLSGGAKGRVLSASPHCEIGINGRRYSGHIGAWQYGPEVGTSCTPVSTGRRPRRHKPGRPAKDKTPRHAINTRFSTPAPGAVIDPRQHIDLMHKELWRYCKGESRGGRALYDELLGHAWEVLVNAARTYRPELGFRFSTHACRALRLQLIRRHAVNSGLRKRYCTPGGKMGKRTSYWQAAPTLAGEVVLGAKPAPGGEDQVDGQVARKVDAEVARASLAVLDERERTVIEHHVMAGRSLGVVGAMLGVSRERVRQVRETALAKCRDELGIGRGTETELAAA